MKEHTREVVFRILVVILLWGAFWIASLGNISLLSLILGILIAIIGILLVGLPGSPSPVIYGSPQEVSQESTTRLSVEGAGTPRQGELGGLQRGHLLGDSGGWVRYQLPNDAFSMRERSAGKAALTRSGEEEKEWILGMRLSKFETTWELAMKEFNPGPRDVLLSSSSHTRIDKELLPGSGDPFEGLSTLGVTGDMPEDILILREVVETRAAPDHTVYQRTIQAIMHRDGMVEYRSLGKGAVERPVPG
jgi:hypothetical protein